MSNLTNISQNELEELIDLMSHINQRLHDYLHVTEYLPKALTNQLDSFDKKLQDEFDKREEQD